MSVALINRLRRMSRDEISWRARVMARTHAQRLSTRLRSTRWDRRRLQRVLATDSVDRVVHDAIAREDWLRVQELLVASLRSRPTRFVLDPARASALRR